MAAAYLAGALAIAAGSLYFTGGMEEGDRRSVRRWGLVLALLWALLALAEFFKCE